jgi:peptidoglycan/LPS O-acetylase OafA/YrhL
MLWMGVDLFFVLSGFLITSILLREKSKSPRAFFGSFYLRRFRRIVPPYLLFLLIAALCCTFEWQKIWYWYALFLVNVGESLHRAGGGVLTSLWSLSVEEQFYLCWPLLVYFVRLERLPYILWCLVIAAPIARGLATPMFDTHFPIYYLTPFRVDLLASGALIAWLTVRDPAFPAKRTRTATRAMLGSVLVFLALTFLVPRFRTGANTILFNTLGYTLVMVCCASLLIVCLALPHNMLYRILTTRVLTYLGTISYMMYLVHELSLSFFKGSGPIVTVVGGLAVTIGAAALSWQFMERRLVQHNPAVLSAAR